MRRAPAVLAPGGLGVWRQDGGASQVEIDFAQSGQAGVSVVSSEPWVEHANSESGKAVGAGLSVSDGGM